MYTLNAFGQRVPMKPLRLRLLTDEEQKAADKAAADKKAADDKAEADRKAAEQQSLGFPAETPLEQMTSEQREAYWKHHARKHEDAVKARSDYDQLKKDSEELAKLKLEGASEQEKALALAREEARREGENIGAERYLGDAVKANFRVATGLKPDDVDKAFAHVDVKSFIAADGSIDQTALTEFASTFGTKEQGDGSRNPVREALSGQQRAGGTSGGGGSIAELQKAREEKLAGKQ
jgi:hypothetical protein